jgi:dihydroflavonol-4-reductase
MAQNITENGKQIFVTGVNGHIGNHIVRDLLQHGYSVKGSVRSLSDPKKVDHVRQHAIELGCEERLELVEGDLLDADGWSEMISGCDALFHTATIYSNTNDGQLIIDTAIQGTVHLLTAAKNGGVNRVIYTSSVAAIGNTPKGREKTEDDWQNERYSPYTIAKTDAERRAWELAETLELDLRVINPGVVLGGGFINPTPSVNFFPDIISGKISAAPKIPLPIVHVKDVARAHRRAYEVEEAKGRFIVAPHKNMTFVDICRTTRKLYPESKATKIAIPKSLMFVAIFLDWIRSNKNNKRMMTRKRSKSLLKGDSNLSSDKASKVLGLEWESLESCIKDTVEHFNFQNQ